jgi:endonuclease/exonuclease/phosphatase family metal-dependent hydrolase
MTYANRHRPLFSPRHGKGIHVLAFLIVAIFLSGQSAVGAADDRDDRTIRVMTYNVDEGTDFQELAAAHSPGDFIAAVGTTYQNIQATRPAERAAAMAREIATKRPDLVGLQEASILRTGSAVPATTVQSDLLQLLLDELAKLGQDYGAIAIVPGLDATAPSPFGFFVRLTTQDAIIARMDLPPAELKLSNVQIRHFATNLIFPSAIGPIPFTRGWASVDAKVRGRMFRFVTTHLEVVPTIQMAQATELLQTAADTTLPVVFAGDFNATADTGLDPTFATYQSIINAGFVDAWRQTRFPDPGFTCCQAPNLLNTTSALSHRSDLILFRGAFAVADIHLIGNKLADRTPSGLWPSDHAGVAATLIIPGMKEEAKQ